MKSVVLLSGGLDSAVNLFEAARAGQVLQSLTFDYGQKAAPSEVIAANSLSHVLNIPNTVISLSMFKTLGHSALTDADLAIPLGSDVQIQDVHVSQKTADRVWVPNRNGVFLNIAAAVAEALGAEFIVPGFNIEEAQTFPDNSEEFLQAMDESLKFSTRGKVKTKCFTTRLNKIEMLQRAIELEIPLDKMWPCYQNLQKWCGSCESCQRSKRAFRSQGLDVEKYFLES